MRIKGGLTTKHNINVCEAFSQMIMENGSGDDREMSLCFLDIFENIDPRILEGYLIELFWGRRMTWIILSMRLTYMIIIPS